MIGGTYSSLGTRVRASSDTYPKRLYISNERRPIKPRITVDIDAKNARSGKSLFVILYSIVSRVSSRAFAR